jgi:hypothetical protein
MIVQILDAQPNRLRRPCPGDRQHFAEQPELGVTGIGGGDEFSHLGVGEDHVAHFLSVRQAGKADFPRLPVLNPLVVVSCQFQGGVQAPANPIDRGGCQCAKQTITPFFQLVRVEELHRLGKQHVGQMHARGIGIVGLALRASRSRL